MNAFLLLALYALVVSAILWSAGLRGRSTPLTPIRRKRPDRIAVIGANGKTGRHLVTQGLDRGYLVTAFVRNPDSLRIEHPNLRIVRGNVLDSATLDGALKGCEAVMCALGHAKYFTGPRILSDGTRNVLHAMETQGVGRLVCLTSLGIGNAACRLGALYTFFIVPLILPLYFWDKTRQERLIAASGIEWVIVRPGGLSNGARRGTVRHGAGIGSYIVTSRVPREDVAGFMLDQLESDAYVGRTPGVV